MKTQKTLTIALATLGLFGVAGAALFASNGAIAKSEPLIIRDSSAMTASMKTVSDVPQSEDLNADEVCDELYAEQQAGPHGGQLGGGGQQGGQGGMRGGPGGQGMGMRMGGGPQGPMILRDPKVQEELHLSQEQIAQIQQALDELRPQGGPGGQGGFGGGQPGAPGGQQGQGRGQGQRGQGQGEPGQGGQGGPPDGQMGERVKQFEEKLKTILNQNQFNRYQQLSLQSAGPNAFNRPDVVEKLGITEEQRQQMREIMEANRPEPPMPPQGGQGQGQGEPSTPPSQEEMQAKQEALMSKLLGVLTAQQRSTWQSMLGVKFQFTMGQPPRQGGGQGRGGGQRGPGGRGGNGGGNGGGDVTQDASIVF